MKLHRLLTATALGAAHLAFATGAYAQTTQPTRPDVLSPEAPSAEEQSEAEASGSEAIIVTGSRIARPNLSSTVPIVSVEARDIVDRGDLSLGDALSELPALNSTFTQANSTRFIGTAGINSLDLRGLGTSRTLVVVNGRRHVNSSPGTYDVDTNTIPTDLIQRVDIVTGGNSAVYGSDAIAGVVNFVLQRDFEGVRFRGQAGTSDEADAGSYFASITAGRNLFDNRLNIAFAGEYAYSEQLLARQRDGFTGAISGTPGFNTVQPATTYNPLTRTSSPIPNRNNDGIPNTQLLNGGIRFSNLNGDGMVQTVCPFLTNAQYDALSPTARAAHVARVRAVCAATTTDAQGRVIPNSFSPAGGPLANFYSFTPTGELVRSVPTGDGRPFGGSVIGGLGSTGLEEAQLRPRNTRISANVLLNGDFGTAFQPFLEAKYVRIDADQTSTQPTFVNGAQLNNTFSIDNPFLTAAQRAQLVTILGVNTAGQPITTFQSNRFNYDLGTRAEDHRRETYRIVVGAAGDISTTGNLRYEISGNWGRTETFYDTGGNVNLANYNAAVDAVRDPATGQIVCRVNADANPNNDRPGCVALNPFGFGARSQAAVDYVLATAFREQWSEQFNAVAFLSGDSTGLFELPGGPVGFAVGAEYRREDAFSSFDDLTISGATFLNAIGAFDPPAQTVTEGFGELRVPLLAEIPFVHELSIEGAVRASKYNTRSDLVWAYNAGVIYAPIPDLRIRGSYGRAVRAPNIGNLFGTPSETFLNGFVDPCNQTVINDVPNRAANCAAAGIPTTIVVGGDVRPWTNTTGAGISGIGQGNPNLAPETSDSFTVGAVVQPSALPGFSFTVDYYNITVNEVISGVAPQQIINRCYDDPGGIENNPFCAAISRRRSSDPFADFTFAGQSNRTFAGVADTPLPRIGPSFINQPFNYAKLTAEGVDAQIAYRGNLGANTLLNVRLVASRNLNRQSFTFISEPERSVRLHGTLGFPEWAGNLFSNIDFGTVDFTYNARFVSRMTVGAWETQFSHQGRPPENPDAFPFTRYPDILYHNIRLGLEPEGSNYRFTLGMDNVLDQLPPVPLDGRGEGGGIYPNVGRYVYASVAVTF